MAGGLPSLHLIAARVDAQLDLQIRHFESLDNKAGIVLGFAGVLVAVAGGTDGFAVVGRVSVVSASLFARCLCSRPRYFSSPFVYLWRESSHER
jgi:hypothetical protein